jgi:hypothetical protein
MSMYPIGTYTVPSSGGPYFGFTFANVPQTFAHLQIRFFIRGTAASYDSIRANFANDVTTSNYRNHNLYGNGTSVISGNHQSVAGSIGVPSASAPNNSSLANVYACYIVDILDYTNTSKNKVVKSFGGWDDNNTSTTNQNVGLFSYMYFLNTNAITSITVAGFNTIAEGTRFDLYGISSSTATGA